MVQHLLIGDLAALALVLGLTGPVLRPILTLPSIMRLRFLLHPFVALPLWALTLWLWHLPALYQSALAHDAVHALEHMTFLVAGMLMWAAVVEPLPGVRWFTSGWKAAYILVVRLIAAALANVFIWSSHVFYPRYAAGERREGISALTDQRIAGAIMFIEGSVVTLVAFAILFLRFMGEPDERQRQRQRRHLERPRSESAVR